MKVFENNYFFAVEDPNSAHAQNIMFVGIKGSKKINYDSLITKTDNEIIKNLKNYEIDLGSINFDLYQVLTDNYAPVEFLGSRIILKNKFSQEPR